MRTAVGAVVLGISDLGASVVPLPHGDVVCTLL
jgi:hypothetical protein